MVSEPNGKGWSRTNDVSNVTDLQSAAIANYAYFPKYISCLFAFKIPNFALDKLLHRKPYFHFSIGFMISDHIQELIAVGENLRLFIVLYLNSKISIF